MHFFFSNWIPQFPQSTEFEISREYVGLIVGSQGAAIIKLRDSLGVKIDFSDEVDEKEKEVGKKKKAAVQKAKVKVSLYLYFSRCSC